MLIIDPAWPLAVALEQLATDGGDDGGEGDEPRAVSAIVRAGHGSVRVLERAYGRALALVNALPDDPGARRAVALISKALGQAARRTQLRTD